MYLRFREKKDPAIWRLDCAFVLDKKAGVSKTLFISIVLMWRRNKDYQRHVQIYFYHSL